MAQLVVRNLEDEVKARLQERARRHGRSMEEEVREILRSSVADPAGLSLPLGQRLSARFAGLGLEEQIEELRGETPRPATFE